MRRDSHFICKTCKEDYLLGYGSYSTWLDNKKSLEEYDNSPNEHKGLLKNQNVRKCLEEHQGHKFFFWSGDWCFIRDKDLRIEKGYDSEVYCENFTDFKKIDLTLNEPDLTKQAVKKEEPSKKP